MNLFWSFLGFSTFSFILFGGLSSNESSTNAHPGFSSAEKRFKDSHVSTAGALIPQYPGYGRSSVAPSTDLNTNIEQSYAPFYSSDGRGVQMLGRVEIKNLKGEIILDLNKPYNAEEAHSGQFAEGMHEIE